MHLLSDVHQNPFATYLSYGARSLDLPTKKKKEKRRKLEKAPKQHYLQSDIHQNLSCFSKVVTKSKIASLLV